MTLTIRGELLKALKNEDTQFNMSTWCKTEYTEDGKEKLPSCNTALCMAGWILALRPKETKRLYNKIVKSVGISPKDVCYPSAVADYAMLASQIWRDETGTECRLDFMADNINEDMEQLTKQQAIAHIRGTSQEWPLLDPGHDSYTHE